MKWILVSKELPEDMVEVLLFDEEKGLSVGYYFSTVQSFKRQVDGLRLNRVVYWAEKPDPAAVEF